MLKKDTYFNVIGVIFAVIAIVHLLRLVYGWTAQIGTFVVPSWLSVVAVIITAYLSYVSFSFNK